MIKKILYATCLGFLALIGCKKDGSSIGALPGKDDAAFAVYENSFLEGLWKLDPNWATSVGYHKYDSLLLVPDNKLRDKLVTYAKVQIDSLSRFEVNTLNESNRIDYRIMQNQMELLEWKLQQLKEYQWNPASYNVTGTFAYILNEHYEPLAQRLRHFYQKMANIPAYYKEAEKQIKNPVAELTSLAINQHIGGIGIFEKDFADSLKKTNIPAAEQKQMMSRAKTSADAIKAYAEWLKALKNDKPHSFRLGKELYEAKFKYEIQSDFTAQQIYNSAVERKKYLHREMAKISKKLWPKYFGNAPVPADSLELISKVIDTLSAKHAEPADFQSAIEKEIPKLTAFVKTKDLVTLDPSKPLIVRREPGYMSGVAGASMSSPGPYDKGGNSYFNVGSLSGWPATRAESYMREYNNYTLQILCIHEAIPGHYVQLLYANKTPGLIKSIFGNGAMVEGWAVYSEEMMLDNGFGGDDPEMRLMWYKWHLRSVCNAILDYAVHTQNMTQQDALKLLTHEAFQQQAEAEGKWQRVTVSSVQLDSYYTGYKEIMNLRNDWKKKAGDKYKLKEFNEKFLSYGSAPVKLIKDAMLTKPADNNTGK
ncbi:DUF885 domain-containing protein [Mucilaginibacter sp. L3T2-6]|uniref:DUF885 domain-containing protein n=1 Tax=Mucilaginibacter sp. L3T2-6 TaxID=3062491 RepID=UPI0026747776|nr:DUF885 domain-containing protein [Mucilaginibacter sp. L3T2-6]MDO3644854.1 DUF885 domain-containing protein [Mucilaginibacter sp. L3T2-6]MDV6217252.1 DUF885 domain-containing protein [Mucilaginibacter sp. L3T2-6]